MWHKAYDSLQEQLTTGGKLTTDSLAAAIQLVEGHLLDIPPDSTAKAKAALIPEESDAGSTSSRSLRKPKCVSQVKCLKAQLAKAQQVATPSGDSGKQWTHRRAGKDTGSPLAALTG